MPQTTAGRQAVIPFIIILCITGIFTGAGCGGKKKEKAAYEVPRRIVSLSPSITRMIIDLRAEDLLVGVTSFHPPLAKPVPVMGTLVNPVPEKILHARPDIVFLSKEDGATQKTGVIRSTGLRVVEFDRNRNFSDIKKNYLRLGELIGRKKLSRQKMKGYEAKLKKFSSAACPVGVIFLVSVRPAITVSAKSFISAAINDAGGKNLFAHLAPPYPVLTFEAVIQADPDCIVVMSRGGKKKVSHRIRNFPLKVNRRDNIFEISPESVAWYTPQDYCDAVKKLRRILSRAASSKENVR